MPKPPAPKKTAVKKKVSKPALLSSKRKAGVWGPTVTVKKKSAKEMSATYRKKAQAKRNKPTHGNANTPGFAFGKETI